MDRNVRNKENESSNNKFQITSSLKIITFCLINNLEEKKPSPNFPKFIIGF